MKLGRLIIYLTVFLLILQSCAIEIAKPSKNQWLIIASDCLHQKDTILFDSFRKQYHVRIYIINNDFDSIQQRLTTEGINTDIDAVILSSTVNLSMLEQKNHFQILSKEEIPEAATNSTFNLNKKWFTIGYDPFILVSFQDSLQKFTNYSDLTLPGNFWETDPVSERLLTNLYPFIYQQLPNATDANKWIHKLLNNKLKNDSLVKNYPFLMLNSQYEKTKNTSQFRKGKRIFPNQHMSGVYYNSLGFGIIHHAKNMVNTISFLNYLYTESVCKRVCYKQTIFPVINTRLSPFSYQNIHYRTYSNN